MPDPKPPAADHSHWPDRWPLWLGLACLIAAVIPFLSRGLVALRTDAVLRTTVQEFLDDVSRGRKEAALALLSDEKRSALLAGVSREPAPPWEPSEKFSSRILSVRQSSSSAEVDVSLGHSGFTLKPTISLRRQPDQTWRITRIDNVAVDPHWTRWKAGELDEAIARELAERLSEGSVK